LADGQARWNYAELDDAANRIAALLQHLGTQPGNAVAVCAANGVPAAAVLVGVLRMGAVVVPLPSSLDAANFGAMLKDSGAVVLWADGAGRALAQAAGWANPVIDIDDTPRLMASLGSHQLPAPWVASPEAPFNIIYSSGTTGVPKGIVQSHGMRWTHIRRGLAYGYGPNTRTLLSTPLYSNTTLVAFAPTLGMGGCVHLMPRFDAAKWLATAQRECITHTMLVPVQYSRLLAHADFDRTDLSAFEVKFCTSAPFGAALKADVLRRWPGGLVEVYGMTEGGGACILEAHRHPHKLHTVGQPGAGHDIRLIDEDGQELPGPWNGEAWTEAAGEVVGRSPGMMSGYHGRPDLTAQAMWHDAKGRAYIRTGDVGRFDGDGFLILMDRRKDMIISGGFNVYPSDLETILRAHPGVADAAVVGVASARWGETPVAWVVRNASGDGSEVSESQLLDWFNARCGKLQRLAALAFIDELPRSAIGKVLKRELRDRWTMTVA
jgi:acyl-CoA synthetase (AMP-forming)/AMP-acid ligase II